MDKLKMESFLILMHLRSVPLSIRDLLSLSRSLSFWRSYSVISGLIYMGSSSLVLELRMSNTMLERRNLISNGLGRSLLLSYLPRRCIISEVPYTKYLGVTIDQKLSWNKHIQRITSKANQINGFLHHNLHQCPVHFKNNCYKSTVRPIFEYASSVWAPHTHTDINKSIQRRAARFCYNDFSRSSSVTRMMSSLHLRSGYWHRRDGSTSASNWL